MKTTILAERVSATQSVRAVCYHGRAAANAKDSMKQDDDNSAAGGSVDTAARDETVDTPRGCLLTRQDLPSFLAGTHVRLYEKLGAHRMTVDGVEGVGFAVWAPNAKRVSVVGDFNDWNPGRHVLQPVDDTGIWASFVPEVGPGAIYKYHLVSRVGGYEVDKADPFAFHCQTPPETAVSRLLPSAFGRRGCPCSSASVFEKPRAAPAASPSRRLTLARW